MPDNAPPSPRCEILTPPNHLKEKVGGTFTGLDEHIIARAEAAVERVKSDNPEWLAVDVVALCRAWSDYVAVPETENTRKLFLASHDLRGQAATFDFPTIARTAHSLCQLIEAVGLPQLMPRALMQAHVEAIAAMFREKGRRLTDPVAAALIAELEAKVQLACRISIPGAH